MFCVCLCMHVCVCVRVRVLRMIVSSVSFRQVPSVFSILLGTSGPSRKPGLYG